MNKGIIREALRKQSRSLIATSGVIVVLCLSIFAFNWKYVFNWFAGPVPFTAALSANPGAREFVSASGPFSPTGYAQETVIKLKGKIPLPKNVTAEYLTTQVEGKSLLVKAPAEELEVGEAVATAAIQKVTVNYPWLAIDKPKEFGTKWTSDRAACESEQELRRKESVGT